MTPAMKREWEIEFQTRLGNLCGAAVPTKAQIALAQTEADDHVAACEYEDWIEKGEGR